jgi:tRNA nucleotidyltransferase (CCA-adding enzyme)
MEACRMQERGEQAHVEQAGPRTGWVHFPHVADVGVHGFGPTPAAAFEQAALALSAIVTDPSGIRPTQRVPIRCDAPDLEMLLADWLNAIVFEMATRGMLFSRFTVNIDGGRLRGEAYGETIDVRRHEPAAEPKGATLSELTVCQDEDNAWHARCVVDV